MARLYEKFLKFRITRTDIFSLITFSLLLPTSLYIIVGNNARGRRNRGTIVGQLMRLKWVVWTDISTQTQLRILYYDGNIPEWENFKNPIPRRLKTKKARLTLTMVNYFHYMNLSWNYVVRIAHHTTSRITCSLVFFVLREKSLHAYNI